MFPRNTPALAAAKTKQKTSHGVTIVFQVPFAFTSKLSLVYRVRAIRNEKNHKLKV